MHAPEIPSCELERLAALDALRLVESPDEERFDRITELARQLFEVPIALVSLVGERRQWFKSVQGLPVRETAREISFCGHAILSPEPLVVEDASADPRFADNPLVTGEPHIRFYAGCPVFFMRQAVGTLCLIDRVPRQLDAGRVRALKNLAHLVENEFRLQELSSEQSRLIGELDESRRQALLDHLTGTWNRRGIDELLPRELSRSSRTQDPVAIMLIDIDHFKQVNDTVGHPGGDAVLQELGRRIRRCIRPHDVLGRFGGDEFLVFLGRCAREDALAIAGRMLQAVRSQPVQLPDGRTVQCTLSIGLYGMPEVGGRSMGQIIEAADQALYAAKDAGRDQVAHY